MYSCNLHSPKQLFLSSPPVLTTQSEHFFASTSSDPSFKSCEMTWFQHSFFILLSELFEFDSFSLYVGQWLSWFLFLHIFTVPSNIWNTTSWNFSFKAVQPSHVMRHPQKWQRGKNSESRICCFWKSEMENAADQAFQSEGFVLNEPMFMKNLKFSKHGRAALRLQLFMRGTETLIGGGGSGICPRCALKMSHWSLPCVLTHTHTRSECLDYGDG